MYKCVSVSVCVCVCVCGLLWVHTRKYAYGCVYISLMDCVLSQEPIAIFTLPHEGLCTWYKARKYALMIATRIKIIFEKLSKNNHSYCLELTPKKDSSEILTACLQGVVDHD